MLTTIAAFERAACKECIVIRSLQQVMKLASADTHVAPIEDGKSERVLEKTSQWCFMIVAVGADDAHQIDDDTNRRFGAVDFGLNGQFISGG